MNRLIIARLLFAIVPLVALGGCWQHVLIASVENGSAGDAVMLGTYLGRSAVTRAVAIDNTTLGSCGFGVNAWYTGQASFDGFMTDGPDPNFMNNTHVTDDGSGWSYSPLKYWPNNPGDKVSFVAYAPHSSLSSDINVDGTELTYTVANEVKEQVDLLWSDSDVYGTLDLEKQAVTERVIFYFRHALAKVTFTVEAAVDEIEAGNNLLDENTVVKVKKVVLMGAQDIFTGTEEWLTTAGPFYVTGKLDLVSGEWSEKSLGQRFLFTKTHFVNETELELDSTNSNEPQELLNPESDLMIIPNDSDGGTAFKVYIEYDVLTTDPDLSDGVDDSSTITNRVASDKTLNIDFLAGRAYNLNLILGMTSVKLDIDVNDWVDADNGNPAVSEDEDLPGNTDSEITY